MFSFSHQPVQPQYYYGSNFGYIVAFKPQDDYEWRRVIVSDPQASRYVHKESSIVPLTKFLVKVKGFNNEGEGPYSLTANISSAQDGEQLLLDTEARRAEIISQQCHRSTRSCLSSVSCREWVNSSVCQHSAISICQCQLLITTGVFNGSRSHLIAALVYSCEEF